MLEQRITRDMKKAADDTIISTVITASGKVVPLEEFLTWSQSSQLRSMNPPRLGTKWTDELRSKVINTKRKSKESGVIYKVLRGGDHLWARKVTTPLGEFDSLGNAAVALGVTGQTIRKWINSGKDGYSFLTPPINRKDPISKGGASGLDNPSAKCVVTPDGTFPTINSAAEYYSVSRDEIRKWIKKTRVNEFKFLNLTDY